LVAHELGLMQVDALFRKDGTYVVELAIDREHLPPGTTPEQVATAAVLSFDGRPIAHGAPSLTNKTTNKANVAHMRISGRTPSAVSRFTFADDAILGYFVITLRNEGQPAPSTQWVEGGKASEPFALDRAVVPPTRWEIIKLYVVLGFTHILPRGLDHVLFVLGLFLLAVELRPILWQVSAFTVAHTITLALTIYGVVSLPPRVVEPLIALSIVYVAVENVLTTRLHAWRPLVVFCFGLLHGMGFAGVLTEIGLPRSEFIPALLAFNAGVELGQLTLILPAFLLIGLPLRRRPWYRQWVVVPLSLLIAATGLVWFVQRVT
ncbi:MAG TPA: HupE/UreJ family protein, partial [Thermoanaerobaculia bacterium]|nr:HupE/UreJ family protein [Thermoanaerobaculia bacterium]